MQNKIISMQIASKGVNYVVSIHDPTKEKCIDDYIELDQKDEAKIQNDYLIYLSYIIRPV